MSGDVAQKLQAAYDVATMRQLGQSLKSGADWKAVQDIQKRHQAARQAEIKTHRDTRDAQMAKERTRLLQQRAQPKLELRPPVGSDHFDKSALNEQAHRNVEQAHHQRLSGIDVARTDEVQALSERAANTREQRPTVAFAKSQGPAHRHKQRQ